ncbi:hypothetical protein ACRRTK_015295 [Alexandromys fortis]
MHALILLWDIEDASDKNRCTSPLPPKSKWQEFKVSLAVVSAASRPVRGQQQILHSCSWSDRMSSLMKD